MLYIPNRPYWVLGARIYYCLKMKYFSILKYGFDRDHSGEECNEVYYNLGGRGGGLGAVLYTIIAGYIALIDPTGF